MRRIILLIITLLFISLFIFYLIWLYTRPQTSTIVVPSPTSQPQQTETLSPTPMNVISITGIISQVSTVSYKNSTLLEVNGTNIYVTEESEVKDAEGNNRNVSELKTDMAISVIGVPAEGGIEAQRVIMISQASITPSRTLSPTPTP